MKIAFKGVIFLLMLAVYSCKQSEDCIGDAVDDLIGRVIEYPKNFRYEIGGIEVDELPAADFTIVTYIDSIGCTPCRMKLSAWTSVINALKLYYDVDLNFVMIIGQHKKNSLLASIKSSRFNQIVVFDGDCSFERQNDIPANDLLKTFLLDADNHVVAVGNPVLNPKVLKMFQGMITANSLVKLNKNIEGESGVDVGLTQLGSEVSSKVFLTNHFPDTLHIESLSVSCDCMTAECSHQEIAPGSLFTVEVKSNMDSVPGYYKQVVEVFFQEMDTSVPVVIYGFKKG